MIREEMENGQKKLLCRGKELLIKKNTKEKEENNEFNRN